MKKLSLLFTFLLAAFVVNAQNDYGDYNHWSIEGQFGVTKPTRPMSSGYSTGAVGFFQGDIGVRYMINERFGLKLDVGANQFKDGGSSAPFESNLTRASLQGVVNAGNLLHFRNWTQTFNLLFHGGVGYGMLKAKKPIKSSNDNLGFVVMGLTPQVKLGNRVALTGDVSMFGNIRQDITFDGTGRTSTRGFNGMYMNGSIGLQVYLGSQGIHADWYNREGSQFDELANRLDLIENDIANVKSDLANHIDDFNNHTADANNNGIPDYMESALDSRYKVDTPEYQDAMRELINNYVSVYFPFGSSTPHNYSSDAVNYVSDFMKKNSSVSIEIQGYADEIGSSDYNQTLSAKRADKIKDILVASGIDAGRISTSGMGEDDSVDKSSSSARQLVRRVIFSIK